MVTSTTQELPELMLAGEVIELREREADAPRNSTTGTRLLIVALDGMNRDLLYDLLHSGELPAFEKLLGGRTDAGFPHAYFNDELTAVLPSSTGAAWTSAMTGVPPAEHGVVGNEFFIRDKRVFAAPVPVSINTAAPVIRAYTDGYWNNLVRVPGVYEKIRQRDPHVQIWVSMHQYQAGADKLVLSEGAVLSDAFQAFLAAGAAHLEQHIGGENATALYQEVDQEAIEGAIEQFEEGRKPDVLTLYIAGTDHAAHVDQQGPDKARRDYLTKHLDPLFEQLYRTLDKSGYLDDCYIVVTSDHGHIEVKHDDRHSLNTEGDDEPPALLRKAGFRPRPFEMEVPGD